MRTKQCSACRLPKVLTEFSRNRSKKDGLQNRCRECSKKRHKEYYSNNRERMRKQIYARNRVRIAENQERVFEYLLEHPCVDCPESDPCVTDFDHRDPSEKSYNVSELISGGYSWKMINDEIQKCDVRCANCHRRKTAKDQKWFTWRLARQRRPVTQSGSTGL